MIGEGASPKILFSYKDIILPTVPIGFQSESQIVVYNDGYKQVNLKHYINTVYN